MEYEGKSTNPIAMFIVVLSLTFWLTQVEVPTTTVWSLLSNKTWFGLDFKNHWLGDSRTTDSGFKLTHRGRAIHLYSHNSRFMFVYLEELSSFIDMNIFNVCTFCFRWYVYCLPLKPYWTSISSQELLPQLNLPINTSAYSYWVCQYNIIFN